MLAQPVLEQETYPGEVKLSIPVSAVLRSREEPVKMSRRGKRAPAQLWDCRGTLSEP